ncbi:MAG: ASKHA domain-containing protein [Defluviitaleaceae bacterium]|nr:ASKHA domain-containing protein [Defluviitaleaceae bacterium]
MNKIHINHQGKTNIITAAPGETILSVLTKQGFHIPAPCGGNGTCGKCAVHTSEGVKLSCQTTATDGLIIYPSKQECDAFAIQDTYESMRLLAHDRNGSYGIAIDIGTTTIAFELMGEGSKICTYSKANSQRSLGADVVTRIKQATEGASQQLHTYIIDDINHGIVQILKKSGISPEEIKTVAIAGNTTMLHLLQNMPCHTLGVFPFTPVDIGIRRCTYKDIPLEKGQYNEPPALEEANTIILPGISTFVGADISAGILCCQSPGNTSPSLLIDLGTNGEMALFAPGKVLTTSTAAGPAFEAGNISQGTASIPGAIAKVRYLPETNVFVYETIENQPPIGICGTGVMDIAAELIRHGLADETGRLEDECFDNGVVIAEDITFTQKDMREIQLAKSSVRSGIEILLEVAGYGYNDIGMVFLAGGFGHKINMESAVTLGLIPPSLASKVVTVGNTSLGGAAHVLLSRKAEEDIIAIANIAKEINLSTHPRFNELFMEHMMFE